MSSTNSTAYTLVHADGSAAYVAPYEPTCAASQRHMAVHLVIGGGWGIVDRRTGRLLKEERKNQHHYPSWDAVRAAVGTLNGHYPE